jgi:hypothetical protein
MGSTPIISTNIIPWEMLPLSLDGLECPHTVFIQAD